MRARAIAADPLFCSSKAGTRHARNGERRAPSDASKKGSWKIPTTRLDFVAQTEHEGRVVTAMDPRNVPTSVKAPHGSRTFEITWADGQIHRLPHRILRGYCPCAGCQGHGGGIRFVDAGDPELRNIAQVGNYALEFGWGDSHTTGIYTFSYLRRLGDLHAIHGDALPEKVPALSEA